MIPLPCGPSGYVVLDASGEFLAWADCIVTACWRLRQTDDAREVVRCSDGAVMAHRHVARRRRAA